MKTMKILAAISAFIISIINFSPLAFAGGGPVDPPVPAVSENPLNIARAFVLKPFTNCQWQLDGYMLIGNQYVNTYINLSTRKDGAITAMSVNGTTIPLPNGPIYGIPMGDGGVFKNVDVYVNAMNDAGDQCGFGQLSLPLVNKGDSIVVPLIPAGIRQEIPCDLSGGNDILLTIEGLTEGYSWGVQNGHLYVWLPPVGGVYNYVVRDMSSGVVIATGTIEPFKPTKPANDTYVGTSYAGNVVEADFSQPDGTDSWTSLENVAFDCNVPLSDGTTVPGKVIFANCGGGGLEVQSFMTQCRVFVQSATAEGDMPFLPLKDNSSSGMTRISTVQKNVGPVVITVINLGPYDHTWLQLHRDYGNGSGTVGVGIVAP